MLHDARCLCSSARAAALVESMHRNPSSCINSVQRKTGRIWVGCVSVTNTFRYPRAPATNHITNPHCIDTSPVARVKLIIMQAMFMARDEDARATQSPAGVRGSSAQPTQKTRARSIRLLFLLLLLLEW